MIVTVAFDVKNHVEVMEGWPIKTDNMTFFLERQDNILERVCLTFSNVTLDHAPTITPANTEGEIPLLQIRGGIYADLARATIMKWQAIISGLQIVDLDYDNYELRFHPENFDEDSKIHVKSFKSNFGKALNSPCDFEQMGRAFCAGPISDDRIESTSHFREGRIAFGAGRYVDSYNNMFLFLETRYCDGKTGNEKQTDMLFKQEHLCKIIDDNSSNFLKDITSSKKGNFKLFEPNDTTREKIRKLVLLRGKLRHHSLKSPHRWDPNKQDEYESAARFLGVVVGDIVIKESLDDIYSPPALKKFRDISIETGHETKIELATYRIRNEKTLSLNMSYPTTVISSQLCLLAVRNAIEACQKDGQLADTVKFEATQCDNDLEILSLNFDVWAYTLTNSIETETPIEAVRCSFEHYRSGSIVRNEFFIPVKGQKLSISDVWRLFSLSFNHIEQKDPTTRIMSVKLFLKGRRKTIATYRVGPQVKN